MSSGEWTVYSAICTVVDIIVAAAIIVYVLNFHPWMEAQRRRREGERNQIEFQRTPRVGDRAGYHARSTSSPDLFMVGEVVNVRVSSTGEVEVELRTSHPTPFGASDWYAWRPVSVLRWFPPDTPLGWREET